jgi:hypothetical protein
MLEYPGGRVCECELGRHAELHRGSEFQFYDRRWRVDRLVRANESHPEPRWYCIPISPGALDPEP